MRKLPDWVFYTNASLDGAGWEIGIGHNLETWGLGPELHIESWPLPTNLQQRAWEWTFWLRLGALRIYLSYIDPRLDIEPVYYDLEDLLSGNPNPVPVQREA